MRTRWIDVRQGRLAGPDEAWLARCLADGWAVAFPTETFYGLGAVPWSEAGVEAVLAVKGERAGKPLPLVLASTGAVLRVAGSLPESFAGLAGRFWPGPLTLVLPARPDLAPPVAAGSGGVGVRVSSQPVATLLARLAGGALVATSANRSGAAPARRARPDLEWLDGLVAAVLDGGPTPGGRPSTVLDLTVAPARILREGAIGRGELAAAVAIG